MRVLTTTEVRKNLAQLISRVRYSNKPVAIGRRFRAEALLVKFPDQFNPDVDEATNLNQYGGGFDFLEDEPEQYNRVDLKKSYV